MLKPFLKNLIANLGFLHIVDQCRMWFYKYKNRKKNLYFKKRHPDFSLPPDEVLYETFKLDYFKYFESGRSTAEWIISSYKKHRPQNPRSILDWGCGPGRVVRHLPELLSPGTTLVGSDFNPRSVEWCRENIPQVTFYENNIEPPLPWAAEKFDLIYAISVFTHLSEKRFHLWIHTISELLEDDGIFIFTSQGNSFKSILTSSEIGQFEKGQIVVRRHHQEGRRIFSAFHPPQFIKESIPHFRIIEHQNGTRIKNVLQQDVWILCKDTNSLY